MGNENQNITGTATETKTTTETKITANASTENPFFHFSSYNFNPEEMLRKRNAIKPALNNCFYVVLFGVEDSSLGKNDNLMATDIAPLLCSKITLPTGFNIQYEDSPSHFQAFVKNASYPQDGNITFTWLEDSHYHVWRYHYDWLTCYFDPKTQRFKVGAKGKIRHAVVDIINYEGSVGKDEKDFFGSSIHIEPKAIHRFLIFGLQPKGIANGVFSFDVTKTSELGAMEYSYKYSNIEYIYLGEEKSLYNSKEKLSKERLRIL